MVKTEVLTQRNTDIDYIKSVVKGLGGIMREDKNDTIFDEIKYDEHDVKSIEVVHEHAVETLTHDKYTLFVPYNYFSDEVIAELRKAAENYYTANK